MDITIFASIVINIDEFPVLSQ